MNQNVKLSTKFAACVLSLWQLSWGLGCGLKPGDQPELGLVRGIVTMDDKPLSAVTVIFSPQQGRSSMAMTDETGRYELNYLWNTRGAKLGRHTISVSTISEDDFGTGGTAVRETIPEKYNTKSTLTADVQSGENLIDIPLVSN